MTTCLHDIINQANNTKYATQIGTKMHNRLAQIQITPAQETGDSAIIAHIKACPGAKDYFTPAAQTEVPVAGIINGRFISRRIDRMYIDPETHTVHILDYKTDIDKTTLRTKYITQLKEYVALMRAIYPDYKITAAILWTHDWSLENILK